MREGLIADNFAGGGGASTGIEQAFGRPVDIAINHDPEAIALHTANHPETTHFCENVWRVDPVAACGGQPVALARFSPDCKHFSKARGRRPTSKKIRGLAWVAVRWAKRVRPAVICLENVEEFQDWGPVDADGRPCPMRKGFTFRRFVDELRRLGYRVEWRELRACDYGAPTIRKRLFLVARCDVLPIVWPAPTHGPGLIPYRAAADIIDFSIPCPSTFTRKRPLADATMRRIARGIQRFVIGSADPFIIPITHRGDDRVHSINEPLRTVTTAHRGELALVTAFLAQHNGGVVGHDARQPVSTLTARCTQQQLVTSHLMKLRNNCDGQDLREPIHTLTTGGHFAEVRALLIKYYGTDQNPDLREPLDTVTTKDRFALVTVTIEGTDYVIVDIGMRMLTPRELYSAQGFPPDYKIDVEVNGKPITKTAQVRMAGNAVCPPPARALIRAQLGMHQAATDGPLFAYTGTTA